MTKLSANPEFDLAQVTDEERQALKRRWRNNPVLYFVERLGIPINMMDAHEIELLEALPRCIVQRKPLVVPSAHAMGKDFTISGRATLWFYECFDPCKVIMTGPTERQVKDIMWNELKAAYNGRLVKDDIGRLVTLSLTGSEEWFISAFTTKESSEQAGKFQGIHSARIMVVVSEAQAVDDLIFDQIEALTMAEVCLVCYLGNPLTNIGRFAQEIENTEKNIVIHLDGYDSINVKSKKQVLPGLLSYDWVMDKEKRWNADGSGKDPRYMARVRGLLPTSSINAVISKELYRRTINRELSWWSSKFISIGVDPAGTGTDDMVISTYISGELVDEYVIPTCEAPEACSYIATKQKEFAPQGGCVITIDSDGLGGPIAQFYRRMMPQDLSQPITLIEFHGSSTNRNPENGEVIDEQFYNARAEAEFYAKERMSDGHISHDDNQQAYEEATNTLYFTRKGKILIEDKEDIKARLSRSPNRWNARVLGIWGFKYAKKIEKKDSYRQTRSQSVRINTSGSAMAG